MNNFYYMCKAVSILLLGQANTKFSARQLY